MLAEAGAALPLQGMSLGEYGGCALDSAGQVYCWGDNGTLERGTTASVGVAPNHVTALADAGVAQVVKGRGWTCVLDSTSHVRCFGAGGSLGYLGGGPSEPTFTADPVTVVDVDGGGALASVARIYGGAAITCAILTGSCGPTGPGPVVCWGYGNDVGGNGTPPLGTPAPVLLP
jgi:hypothetical protein